MRLSLARPGGLMVRMLVAVGVVSAGVFPPPVAAAEASSALPTCYGVTHFKDETFDVWWPTTTNGSYDLNCTLREGNRGAAVRTLQQALNACWGANLDTDGIFGPRTAAWVAAVQEWERVRVDNVYGPKTWYQMHWPWWIGGAGSGDCYDNDDDWSDGAWAIGSEAW